MNYLEAQWAAFFAEVGVQYEPKTIPLLNGWYIPDFWLKRAVEKFPIA